MDDAHLMAATRYVERNPVKAVLVECAEDWPWSSAAAHVRGRADHVAETQWLAEETAGWVCTWGEYLQEEDDVQLARALRQRESTGRPLGDETFIQKLGALLGRNLTRKKPGPAPAGKRR